MATKKTTPAKRVSKEARNLTYAEQRKLLLLISKARIMAVKMSEDKNKYNAKVRRTLHSFGQQLWKLSNTYPWSSITD